MSLLLACAAVYGLILGSFLNVCIHRLPRGQSVMTPRSRCPHCRHAIAWYDNLPLVSFARLRGRCRHCRRPISWRYPAVEAAAAALVVLMVWRWQHAGLTWAAAAGLAAGLLLAVTVIDWETFLIPDPLSLGLLALAVAAAPLNPLLTGSGLPERLLGSGLGAAAGFLMTWLTAVAGERIFRKEALGGGDIKLLAAVGALTGASGAFTTLMLGSTLGAAYGLWQMAAGRLGRQQPIPFGPFLSAGALIVLLDVLPPGFPFFLGNW